MIIRDEAFPGNPKEAIWNGFAWAEKCYLGIAETEYMWTKNINDLDKSGSCVIACLIVEDMCYVANVGDSWAIMSAEGGNKIYALSWDHRPNDEIEKIRISQNGGKIY